MSETSLSLLRTALFGSPETADNQPSKTGVLFAFEELITCIETISSNLEALSTQSLDPNPKAAVEVAATGNVSLSGEQIIDGVLTSASRVAVLSQTNPTENGIYITGAGAWARSDDTNTASLISFASFYVDGGALNNGSSYIIAVNENVVLGTDEIPIRLQNTVGAGLNAGLLSFQLQIDETEDEIAKIAVNVENLRETLTRCGYAMYEGDENVIPWLTDENGKVIAGYNKTTELLEGAGFSDSMIGGVSLVSPPVPLINVPATAKYNVSLGLGQSWIVGANTNALTVTQPFENITFAGGPRVNDSVLSTIPLIENDVNAPGGGATTGGETITSTAANYVSRRAAIEKGVAPEDFVIFGYTDGRGSSQINAIHKGSNWWFNRIVPNMQAAYDLDNDTVFSVVNLDIGQSDAAANTAANAPTGGSGIQFGPTYFYDKLLEHQNDISDQATLVTGQQERVHFVVHQTSVYTTVDNGAVAQHQLDACLDSEYMHLLPTYHIPIGPDNIHPTAFGQIIMGSYDGRYNYDLQIRHVNPEWFRPLSATMIGNIIRVKCHIPHKPMLLDHTTLASTINSGFNVLVDGVQNPIVIVTIQDDDVLIEVTNTPPDNSDVRVRYAMDFQGDGLNGIDGASGNLRDSEPEKIMLPDGTSAPIYNVCPAFDKSVIRLEA